MSKAYILGAGPAGLVAAHAATLKGYDVEIATDQMSPSIISGAQYLDKPIPSLTELEPDGRVKFFKRGTAEGYAQKIYGDPQAPTSWDKYEHEVEYPLWYLRDTYSILWERYKDKLFHLRLTPNVMASFVDTDADMIVVALPLQAICSNERHTFWSQEVTVYPGLPVEIADTKYGYLMEKKEGFNWILYNGKKKEGWYRCSAINGGASVEVPGHYDDGHKILKPLRTTCDCWGNVPRVVPVGRYGTWQKDQLVSGAWDLVLDRHYAVQ